MHIKKHGLCRRCYQNAWQRGEVGHGWGPAAPRPVISDLANTGQMALGPLEKYHRRRVKAAALAEKAAAKEAAKAAVIQARLAVQTARIEARAQAKIDRAAADEERRAQQARLYNQRARAGSGRDKARRRRLLTRYGLTPETFQGLLISQDDRCAICNIAFKHEHNHNEAPNIDHCHATNRVRGLLCRLCNLAVGLLRDSQDLAIRTAEYLRSAHP